MKAPRPSDQAWSRLSRLGGPGAGENTDIPFGFASRVVAAWHANRRETTLAAFEWLTLRTLAVALIIFAGSAAFGYETLSDVITGTPPMVDGWLDMLSLPL
jgi:hypothetical protein